MNNINDLYNRIIFDSELMRRLRNECEQAKCALSTDSSIKIKIDNFLAFDEVFEITITREQFESLNSELFDSCMTPLKQVLGDANVTTGDIEEILFVDGSTRIPCVTLMIEKFFNGKKPCKSIDRDQAVAVGAAIQGAVLSDAAAKYSKKLKKLKKLKNGSNNNSDEKQNQTQAAIASASNNSNYLSSESDDDSDSDDEMITSVANLENLLLLDVTPLSLGVETDDGEFDRLIKRNTYTNAI